MNIVRLSVKNWTHFAKEHILSIILISASIALIILSMQLNEQIQKKFERNLAGIDMIIAAKGSPLQIVLSSMFHIDAPTGNIPLEDVKAFFREGHPYIKSAVPLGLGDSYKSYRVVGTTDSWKELYPYEITEGRDWQSSAEVIIGAEVADVLSIKIGDKIQSAHGYNMDDMTHDHDLSVVGIMGRTGTVSDQLILTSIQTIWDVHGAGHDHNHDHDEVVMTNREMMHFEDQDITSILIDFPQNSMQTLQWPRQINTNTNLQAVTPSMEAARLYDIMGRAGAIATWIGRGLLFISLLSLVVSLYLNFDKRKSQQAILRMVGLSTGKRIIVTVLEVLWTLILGVIVGFAIAHLSLYFLSQEFYEQYKVHMDPWSISIYEFQIISLFILVGIIAVIIPAWRAARTEIDLLLR